MSKTKTTDYVFLSANLRAREPNLLTRERLGRMVDTPDYETAAKILAECGYPELENLTDAQLETVFAERRAKMLDELEKLAPEPALATAFRLKYDYHNIKVLVKAEGADIDGAPLLSACGRIAPDDLIKAYTEDDWRDFPETLAAAAVEAKETLAHTGNPQLTDVGLDKAYFTDFLALAESISDDFLVNYGKLSVDVANLRAAVRCVRSHMDDSVLKTALIPGGNIKADSIYLAAHDREELAAAFSDRLAKAAELGAAAIGGAPLAAFELECDNIITRYLENAKMLSFGPGVAVSYLAALEGEIVAARMVLIGKRNGLTPEALRERLRDCYV